MFPLLLSFYVISQVLMLTVENFNPLKMRIKKDDKRYPVYTKLLELDEFTRT